MKKKIILSLSALLVISIACKKEIKEAISDVSTTQNFTTLPTGIDQWEDMLWFQDADVIRGIVNDPNYEIDQFNQIGGFVSFDMAVEEMDTNILEGTTSNDLSELLEDANYLFFVNSYVDENDSTVNSLEPVIDCEYMAHFANQNRALRVGDSVYTFWDNRLDVVYHGNYSSYKTSGIAQRTMDIEKNYFGYSENNNDMLKRRTSCRTTEYTNGGRKYRFRGYLAASKAGWFYQHITLVTRHYRKSKKHNHWYGHKAPQVDILDGEVHIIVCEGTASIPCGEQNIPVTVLPESKNNKKKVRLAIYSPLIMGSNGYIEVDRFPPGEGSWSKHGGKQKDNTIVDCTGTNIQEGF